MATFDDVRRVALSLPRTEERLVGERVKFRVGRLVYLSVSADEQWLGFAFPREERAALIAAEPDKFHPPHRSDERYNWVRLWLPAVDSAELRELIVDAWRMVVPKRVAAAHLDEPADSRGRASSTRPRPGPDERDPSATRPPDGR